MPPRQCMFCSAPASSKEDVLPRWLVELIPTPHGVHVEAERGRHFTKRWKAAKHELTVRHVCKDCSNGWMSRLEGRTKPIIRGLFDDTLAELTPDVRQTLGQWSVKTTMVLEALRSGANWFYRPDERMQMRADLSVPLRTRAWLAKCINLPGTYCASSDLAATPDHDPQEATGYVTTIAFRGLVLQVVTGRAPSHVPPTTVVTTEVLPGPWDHTTVSLWPPSGVSKPWPPRLGLDGEAGLGALIDRWKLSRSSE